ncbi:zinc ribbon domain-containing protein [Geothrix sp. 21YS21S-2]|uniref:zinc ribbon domain-containing protein n=1 Tax=Geothrix sp. 21YS21S-2 TaxID=3068893 RepID=UPI00358F1FB2
MNPAYSTIECRVCHAINPDLTDLRVRKWICSGCQTHHHRDGHSDEKLLVTYLDALESLNGGRRDRSESR